jgi:hypothetical protein
MFDGIKSQQVPPEKEEAPQLTELSPWDTGPQNCGENNWKNPKWRVTLEGVWMVLKQLRGYQPTHFEPMVFHLVTILAKVWLRQATYIRGRVKMETP